jgi:maleylacetate reductase
MTRVVAALATGGSAADRLYDLAARIGAPTSLEQLGPRADRLDEAVGLVLEAAPADNPRPFDVDGVRRLIEEAFAGPRPEV